MLAATAKQTTKIYSTTSITKPQLPALTTNHHQLLHDTTVPVSPHIGQEISVSV